MSLSKLWTNYSAKIVSAGTYLDGVVSAALNNQLSTGTEGADGNVFASFGHLMRGAPAARLTSLSLKGALDVVGVTSATAAGVALYFRRMTNAGTRDAAGAGTHISATLDSGVLVPRRISARTGELARIDLEALASKSDGTNPITWAVTANLPGNTPGVQQVWTVGPVNLNGTVLGGVESVDVDFGVEAHAESREGDIFPSFTYVRSQRPVIRVRCAHADIVSTLTGNGTYYASGVIVYFRARAEGSTFIADATASHIKLTLAKCRVQVDAVDGDPKSAELTITPWNNDAGPTVALAVNTASAIT